MVDLHFQFQMDVLNAVLVFKKSIDWTMLLTGTPIQNNLRELYALLCLLDKSAFPFEMEEEFTTKHRDTEDENGLCACKRIQFVEIFGKLCLSELKKSYQCCAVFQRCNVIDFPSD